MKTKTYSFYIADLHCASCVLLTETELGAEQHVRHVAVDLARKTVSVSGTFGDMTRAEVAAVLAPRMAAHGYTLTLNAPHISLHAHYAAQWKKIREVLPLVLLITAVFALIQSLGLADFALSGTGVWTPLFIGALASLSSCGAVVGALALSGTAHYSARGERVVPQVAFHAGRLSGFALLGALLGVVGGVLHLSTAAQHMVAVLVVLLMIVVGISLLELLPIRALTIPIAFAEPLVALTRVRHPFVPFLLGALTFFAPCGFTQSAQLYALGLGNAFDAGRFMGLFALGTLPVLALITAAPGLFAQHIRKEQSNTIAGLIVLIVAAWLIFSGVQLRQIV